jgi:hypothetical protein
LPHKVSKSNQSFAPRLDKHHYRQPHHTLASLSISPLAHLTSKSTRTIPDTTTKIPAQSTSDHGHLEDHQWLIRRRSRAARKEDQEGSKEPAESDQVDKTTIGSRSRRSRRAPESSLIPTSILLKSSATR